MKFQRSWKNTYTRPEPRTKQDVLVLLGMLRALDCPVSELARALCWWTGYCSSNQPIPEWVPWFWEICKENGWDRQLSYLNWPNGIREVVCGMPRGQSLVAPDVPSITEEQYRAAARRYLVLHQAADIEPMTLAELLNLTGEPE